MKNILVRVVLSGRCGWAARYVSSLAKKFGAQLIFLNVGQDKSVQSIEEFVARDVGEVPHKAVIIEGDPADRIVELAQEYQVDLIVMPTYNVRFRPFLIGSVTAKVLHDAACPVLTVSITMMTRAKPQMHFGTLCAPLTMRPDVFRCFVGLVISRKPWALA